MFHNFVLEMLLVYRSIQFIHLLSGVQFTCSENWSPSLPFFSERRRSHGTVVRRKRQKKTFTITNNRLRRSNYRTNLSA